MESAPININIKYGNEKYAFELKPDISVQELRNEIYQLTIVPPQNQKLVYKGKVIKDETSLKDYKIIKNANIVVTGAVENMGIDDQLKDQPKTQFVEDLTAEQKAQIIKEIRGYAPPVGLHNLGNTCYINSNIQCLKRINELKDFLIKNPQNIKKMQNLERIGLSLGNLFRQMEKTDQPLKPEEFITNLFNLNPVFAERQGPVFKQQDAQECYSFVYNALDQTTQLQDEKDNISLVKKLFGFKLLVTLTNNDNPEDIQYKEEEENILGCNVYEENVSNVNVGIQYELEGQLEKNSELDNQNHIFNKKARIQKLSPYICVQMKRFAWKQGYVEAQTEAGKAKIMKSVPYQEKLDVFEFCTEELQTELQKGRKLEEKLKDQDEEKQKQRFDDWKNKLEKKQGKLEEDTKQLWKRFKEEAQKEDIKKHDAILYREHGKGQETGMYQLIAVLTHKGRSSDEGHYMSYVHQSGENWTQYDDDKDIPRKTADIMNLKGGGDRDMGYLFFYRKLEVAEDD